MDFKKLLLLFFPLLFLTSCDINKHEYHVEYVDGVTFDFKADDCRLYKDGQLLACQSDGAWMFSVRWDLVKHFHDLTQDRLDQQEKERQEYFKRQQTESKNENNSGGGSAVGTIIVLHILGIL